MQTAIASQLCIIPFSQLQAIPWFIDGGDSIWVQIIATNDFGPSAASTGNGAVYTRIPDAPLSLIENLATKTDTSIDLEWQNGYNNGGLAILDYRVSYSVEGAEFAILVDQHLSQSYTATGMVLGTSYKFKVQARNPIGLSPDSATLDIFHAFVPD